MSSIHDEAKNIHQDPTAIIPSESTSRPAPTESGILALKNALAGTVALKELGMNWPIVIWIALVHVIHTGRGRPVLFQLAGVYHLCCAGIRHWQRWCLHGLSPLAHAPEL